MTAVNPYTFKTDVVLIEAKIMSFVNSGNFIYGKVFKGSTTASVPLGEWMLTQRVIEEVPVREGFNARIFKTLDGKHYRVYTKQER